METSLEVRRCIFSMMEPELDLVFCSFLLEAVDFEGARRESIEELLMERKACEKTRDFLTSTERRRVVFESCWLDDEDVVLSMGKALPLAPSVSMVKIFCCQKTRAIIAGTGVKKVNGPSHASPHPMCRTQGVMFVYTTTLDQRQLRVA